MPEKRPGRSDDGTGTQRTDGAEAAFDLWLQRGLRKLFGEVDATVPDELVRVIQDDDAKRRR